MNLPDYIEQMGTAKFAELVDCSKSAVAMYRRKERIPNRTIAKRIVERTPLKWEDIYEELRKSS